MTHVTELQRLEVENEADREELADLRKEVSWIGRMLRTPDWSRELTEYNNKRIRAVRLQFWSTLRRIIRRNEQIRELEQ